MAAQPILDPGTLFSFHAEMLYPFHSHHRHIENRLAEDTYGAVVLHNRKT